MWSSAQLKSRFKPLIVRYLLGFDSGKFIRAIQELGVSPGDVIMLHSSWSQYNGYRGRPADLIRSLMDYLGPDGVLIMPSLSYQNQSSKDFLLAGTPMDVRRSPSRMGLLSEVFRRGKDVVRSLSPTHPLLAWGNRAEELLAGHERCPVPFGKASPFDKLLSWNGKILTLDAPFSTITYTHFLEDRISENLDFPFYEPEAMPGSVVDYDGNRLEIPVRVIGGLANRLRCEQRLVQVLEDDGIIKKARVGNTRLMLIEVGAMTAAFDRWTVRGGRLFDTP